MTQIDKAGANYWDQNWSQADIPKLFDHNDQNLDNYVNLQLHEYLKVLLKDKKEFSVLEIGCANSVWPMYFYQQFNAEIHGLDYSEIGCEKSRRLLNHYKIPGEIYCADLFTPPADLLEKFDLVVSFGVVEHFENTTDCINACAAFVKPGGMIFTLVPNIAGIIGSIQKRIDKSIYDIHVPLTSKMLRKAHENNALDLKSCNYFMSINLSVVHSGSFASHPFNPFFRRILSGISKIVWSLEKIGIKLPTNRFTSPYIVAVATKK